MKQKNSHKIFTQTDEKVNNTTFFAKGITKNLLEKYSPKKEFSKAVPVLDRDEKTHRFN